MWCKDLMEYFDVDEETCINLGKPFKHDAGNKIFPSKIKNISREEIEKIWNNGDWNNKKHIFENYRRISSWLTFRQVYKHEVEDKTDFKGLFFEHIVPNSRILEYGCGVAPLSYCVIKNYNDFSNIEFNLCDLDSEHYTFGQYRLKKYAPKAKFNFYYSKESDVSPKIKSVIDIACIMDVLEHLINPYQVIVSIYNKMPVGGILVETWVSAPPVSSNLKSSYNQKEKTMKFIADHYKQIKTGAIRKWIKL